MKHSKVIPSAFGAELTLKGQPGGLRQNSVQRNIVAIGIKGNGWNLKLPRKGRLPMTARPDKKERKSIKELQDEVKEKIRLGLLPPDAEVAVCTQKDCKHFSHRLET